MSKTKVNVASAPRPHGRLQPTWLQNNYDDSYWRITGKGPGDDSLIDFDVITPDGSLLTEQKWSHILETIKSVIIEVRTGFHSHIDSAATQVQIGNSLINLALWMMLNDASRFDQLTTQDYVAYRDKAIYGVGNLMDASNRLRAHVEFKRSTGSSFPIKESRNQGGILDATALCKEFGLDFNHCSQDQAFVFGLKQVAVEVGCYLDPREREILIRPVIAEEKITTQQLWRLLIPWQYLWELRRRLPLDRLTFDPFPASTSYKEAAELGIPVGRTKTIPVSTAMHIIECSLTWVLYYAEELLDLREHFEKIHANFSDTEKVARKKKLYAFFENYTPQKTGLAEPWPLDPVRRKINSKNDNLSFNDAVNGFIPVACLIVICALTARRHDEVIEARENCISFAPEGPSITLWIEKTVQNWEKTPCPDVVVRAVEILKRWSEGARKQGEPRLFQVRQLTEDRVTKLDVGEYLKKFVEYIAPPDDPATGGWNLTLHQLRRFFAIMYVWRYEYANLGALSYHLRHFNPDMVLRYVTEACKGGILEEVQATHRLTILTQAATGKRNITGAYGERFKRAAQKIRALMIKEVTVLSEKDYLQKISQYIERRKVRLKPFPWGYCTCGSSTFELRKAHCLKNSDLETATGPELSNSSPATCAGCPFNLTHEGFKPYWQEQYKNHANAAADETNAPLLRNFSGKQADILGDYVKRCFEDSMPLDSIKCEGENWNG